MHSESNPRYRIAVHRLMGCYFARVVQLPGCVSRGATEVEAVENARAAIRAYLWITQALARDEARVVIEINAIPSGPEAGGP